MRPRLKRLIFIAPLAILGMLLFIAIGGEVVRLLWNWLLPPLFGFARAHLLAGPRTAGAVPDPLRRARTARPVAPISVVAWPSAGST